MGSNTYIDIYIYIYIYKPLADPPAPSREKLHVTKSDAPKEPAV